MWEKVLSSVRVLEPGRLQSMFCCQVEWVATFIKLSEANSMRGVDLDTACGGFTNIMSTRE